MDPWSLYWKGNNLESCIAAQSEDDRQQIAQYWETIASELGDSAAALDLACGNGVVAAHLLKANPGLSVSGVDQAEIAPQSLSQTYPELAKVSFFPRTSVANLPFADQSFDLLVSQFGVEYGPLEESSAEAIRVLRPEGQLAFLVHHKHSAIVKPGLRHLQEVSTLLAREGLLQHARNFCSGNIALQELERHGQDYLDSPGQHTSNISGQIFNGINQVIELMHSGLSEDSDRALQLINTMHGRLLADQGRLQQMESAALNETEFAGWVDRYSDLGLDVHTAEPMTIQGKGGDALIAWQLRGRKKP